MFSTPPFRFVVSAVSLHFLCFPFVVGFPRVGAGGTHPRFIRMGLAAKPVSEVDCKEAFSASLTGLGE
jgi:hypothetical protein